MRIERSVMRKSERETLYDYCPVENTMRYALCAISCKL